MRMNPLEVNRRANYQRFFKIMRKKVFFIKDGDEYFNYVVTDLKDHLKQHSAYIAYYREDKLDDSELLLMLLHQEPLDITTLSKDGITIKTNKPVVIWKDEYMYIKGLDTQSNMIHIVYKASSFKYED